MSDVSVKTEEVDRLLEVSRLRKVMNRAKARIDELSASEVASQLAHMASDGKYIMIEIDSENEETERVVEGDPKTVNVLPRTVENIKKEIEGKSWKDVLLEHTPSSEGEETLDSRLEDSRLDITSENSLDKASPNTRRRMVCVKRKIRSKSRKNISPRYVNDSLNSDVSMSLEGVDKSPREVLVFVQEVCKDGARMKELISILSSWNKDGIFDRQSVSIETKHSRSSFCSGLKASLNNGEFDCLSIKFEIARLFVRNPEAMWRLLSLVLYASGDGDVPGLVSMLDYRDGHGIIIPAEWEFDEDWDGEDLSSIESPTKQNRLEEDQTDLHGSTLQPCSSDVTVAVQSGNQRPEKSPCDRISSSFEPPAVSTPKFVATSSDGSLTRRRDIAATGFVHFSPVEDAVSSGYGFVKVDMVNTSKEEVEMIYGDARRYLDTILSVHEGGLRKPIGDWLKMVDSGSLKVPTPEMYHRDYTPEYLSKSFSGEPLPGVYMPCSSGWSESRAVSVFANEKGVPPPTIKDLNSFVEEKYPVVLPDWDPSVHISGIPAYSLDIYPKLNLPLRPPSTRNVRGEIGAKYTPYCWETARQRVNVHGNLLRPLFPFIADPLLTTVSFNFELSERFLGRSLPHPNGSGRLVCRTRPFNTSALTNNTRVNKSTLMGRCGYCNGLYVLPSHNVTLCYFVPDGLKVVTTDIIAAWKCGRISVCAVHFLHRGRMFNNGLLNNIEPGV